MRRNKKEAVLAAADTIYRLVYDGMKTGKQVSEIADPLLDEIVNMCAEFGCFFPPSMSLQPCPDCRTLPKPFYYGKNKHCCIYACPKCFSKGLKPICADEPKRSLHQAMQVWNDKVAQIKKGGQSDADNY